MRMIFFETHMRMIAVTVMESLNYARKYKVHYIIFKILLIRIST